ncbi:MAG: TonB-dependent receptor plug domain-containing protein, partial [Cytophagaceae bacterium]|nr:TonB-dependent receptor plug domain-containing protein [Cytophagaceae bacterium]
MFKTYFLQAVLVLGFFTGLPTLTHAQVLLAKVTPSQQQDPTPGQPTESRSLAGVLKELYQQRGIFFSYDEKILANKFVTPPARTNASIEKTLTRLLKDTGLKYQKINGNTFLILEETSPTLPKETPRKISTTEALIESRAVPSSLPIMKMQTLLPRLLSPMTPTLLAVSGRVTDEAGAGIPGATVRLKASATVGTSTDREGRFSLSLPDGTGTLVVSSVGYATQEIAVGNQTTFNVTLKADAQALDEVVVTAFGVKRDQKALGYATQTIEGSRLSAVSNTNLGNALQGKAAGVTVRLASGMPGRAPQVTIRGARSLTGNNQPLYVIDGLPVAGGDRTVDFNPSDVESINILKGPAASALYGLRASNGVIVITTKSGKAGQTRPTVSFDTQVSADRAAFLPYIQQVYSQGAND